MHLTSLLTGAFFLCSSIIAPAAGVDIVHCPDYACSANNCGFCRNIPAHVCCRGLRNGVYLTHHSASAGSGNAHYPSSLYNPKGASACGTVVAMTSTRGPAGPFCVKRYPSGAFVGSTWYVPSSKEANSAGPAVTGEVDEDAVTIDGHVFKVNYDVPSKDTKALYDLMENGTATIAEVPRKLMKYHLGTSQEVLGIGG